MNFYFWIIIWFKWKNYLHYIFTTSDSMHFFIKIIMKSFLLYLVDQLHLQSYYPQTLWMKIFLFYNLIKLFTCFQYFVSLIILSLKNSQCFDHLAFFGAIWFNVFYKRLILVSYSSYYDRPIPICRNIIKQRAVKMLTIIVYEV